MRRVPLTAFVASYLLACGGDAVELDASTPELFCRSAAGLTCNVVFDCLDPDERAYDSKVDCQRSYESQCEADIEAELEGPTGSYQQAIAETCLARFARIERIRVRIDKPSAPIPTVLDYAAIEIERERHP